MYSEKFRDSNPFTQYILEALKKFPYYEELDNKLTIEIVIMGKGDSAACCGLRGKYI